MINKAAQGVHGLHNVALKELRGAQKEIKNISDALRALPRLDRRQRTYSSSECPCIVVSMFFVGCAGVRYLPNVGCAILIAF